jgi:hypothetical protein
MFALLWVIYDHPLDYPNHWVVRAHVVFPGITGVSHHAYLYSSLEEARRALPPGLVKCNRHPTDDPQIFETWIL